MPLLYKKYVKSPSQDKAVKTYTFVTLSVILLIVLVFFAIRPTITVIFEINEKSKELTDSLAIFTSKNSQLSNIKDTLSKSEPDGIKEDADFLTSEIIPGQDDSLFLAANMDEIAKAHNLSLSSFSPAATAETDLNKLSLMAPGIPANVSAKKVNMAVTGGSLAEVKSFLDDFQGFARLTKITDFNLKGNNDANGNPNNYTANINFIIFYTTK